MSDEQQPLPSLAELPNMVVWYGPTALYATGLRYLISGIFGQYADQRILQWATDQVPDAVLASRYDYSAMPTSDGSVWVDYVGDPGDGFDSCYAIASLVAAQSIDVEGAGRLEGGTLLIMGGDQVYPYASADQYEQHLVLPYSLADWDTKEPDRTLFVLPGNHDWYDGLSAFDQMFCQARDGVSNGQVIGRWHCPQHRSYFAIKLPHDWWIWGLDTQLTRNLDVGQIRYFQAVANSMPDRSKAKIVLCLPQPVWHDAAKAAATGAKTNNYPGNVDRLVKVAFDEAKVCAILSGDLHHYSRYRGTENGLNLITSGGGGAYLSPTHHLPDTLHVPWDGKTHEFSLRQENKGGPGEKPRRANPSLFPSRGVSRALSWRLLLFPFFNRAFSFVGLGIGYWLITWLYMSAPVQGSSYGCAGLERVSNLLRNADQCDVSGAVNRIWLMLDAAANGSIMLTFLVLGMWAVLFAYVRSSSRTVRVIASTLHWAAHIAAMTELAAVFTRFNQRLETGWLKSLGIEQPDIFAAVLFYPAEMIIIGGFIGGVIWGVYLFLNCRIFHLHMDDAFSALRIKQCKQFLRMRIEPDKLTIYPIGLKSVPIRVGWRARTAEERANGVQAAFVARMGLKPHLIEDPIVIRPADVKDF